MNTLAETFSTPKFPNYHPMQNAWSIDFISGFLTHVNHLEFMLLASLLAGCLGVGLENIMRQGVPQYQQGQIWWPRQGYQRTPCQGGPTVLFWEFFFFFFLVRVGVVGFFFWSTHRRWQTLIACLCLSQNKNRSERSGSNGVKREKRPSSAQMSRYAGWTTPTACVFHH